MRKVLALLALVVSIFTLASCGTSHGASSSNKNPASLIGEWHQAGSGTNAWMTASISAGSIQVDMRSRDSSHLYWMGTFNTDRRPTGEFKIVSLADQDALSSAILGSQDSKKTFEYDDGVLSFKYSALGSTVTVHMTKAK